VITSVPDTGFLFKPFASSSMPAEMNEKSETDHTVKRKRNPPSSSSNTPPMMSNVLYLFKAVSTRSFLPLLSMRLASASALAFLSPSTWDREEKGEGMSTGCYAWKNTGKASPSLKRSTITHLI
jgi:hypothetical protein